ncbi:MAG: zinc-ribbon domain-containing protein [Lachnospiraceae bacterium]|nr:zinc-ribbon domain-containing protein [Lachnospiraceae bacterium]
MKCPNCGKEMSENTLYCEHCGEDIHIVPDFEPEIDLHLEQFITEISEEVQRDERKSQKPVIIISLVITVLILGGGIFGIITFRNRSVEYQIKKAEQCVAKAGYEEAAQYYERALELAPDDISLQFSLAEVYFLKNDKIEYENLLRGIISHEATTQAQLESAYGKLIAIYRARGEYDVIQEILMTSDNDAIKNTYKDYFANPPEFSLKSGYYTQVTPLKITSTGKGKIYYTTDGSVPTVDSNLYSAPIILEDGDYLFKVCFINEYGTSSKVITGEYHVEIAEIPAPEIGTISGDYNYPTYIEVLEREAEVYYTTDGSIPTQLSQRYTAPIPMPLGKSVYKFVKVVNGVVSNVAECSYNFTLNTDFGPQQAEEAVVKFCMDNGKITDEEGHFGTDGCMYKYSYQHVIDIESVGHFYAIAEVLQDSEGVMTKTGNNFAVDVYGGLIYKLQRDGNNNYVLVEIQ